MRYQLEINAFKNNLDALKTQLETATIQDIFFVSYEGKEWVYGIIDLLLLIWKLEHPLKTKASSKEVYHYNNEIWQYREKLEHKYSVKYMWLEDQILYDVYNPFTSDVIEEKIGIDKDYNEELWADYYYKGILQPKKWGTSIEYEFRIDIYGILCDISYEQDKTMHLEIQQSDYAEHWKLEDKNKDEVTDEERYAVFLEDVEEIKERFKQTKIFDIIRKNHEIYPIDRIEVDCVDGGGKNTLIFDFNATPPKKRKSTKKSTKKGL